MSLLRKSVVVKLSMTKAFVKLFSNSYNVWNETVEIHYILGVVLISKIKMNVRVLNLFKLSLQSWLDNHGSFL